MGLGRWTLEEDLLVEGRLQAMDRRRRHHSTVDIIWHINITIFTAYPRTTKWPVRWRKGDAMTVMLGICPCSNT